MATPTPAENWGSYRSTRTAERPTTTATTSYQQHEPPPMRSSRDGWVRRHPILSVVIGVVVGGIVLIVALSALFAAGTKGTIFSPDDAASDVTVSNCQVGEFGRPTADVRITNSSETAKTYNVDVAYYQDGMRVDDGFVNIDAQSVAPGETIVRQAGGTATLQGAVTCKMREATKFGTGR